MNTKSMIEELERRILQSSLNLNNIYISINTNSNNPFFQIVPKSLISPYFSGEEISIEKNLAKNYGVKIHGNIEDLEGILYDREIIYMLCKGDIGIKIVDGLGDKTVTLYVPSSEIYKVVEIIKKYLSLVSYDSNSININRIRICKDNVSKIWVRVSPSFSYDVGKKFGEYYRFPYICFLDEVLRAIADGRDKTRNVYALSRFTLDKIPDGYKLVIDGIISDINSIIYVVSKKYEIDRRVFGSPSFILERKGNKLYLLTLFGIKEINIEDELSGKYSQVSRNPLSFLF